MPIEVKELIVRAWVDSQASGTRHEERKIARTANETSDFQTEILDQLKRIMTDKKDR
ncbi:MAG TPA: DUF5908 family protein [Bacteroidia bacterium]|nr:DUF5908 family protein [Bacteroidia bacterium]